MTQDPYAYARNPNGTYDGTKVLSALSGGVLQPGDVKSIWEEVKANKAAWDGCPAPHHVVDLIDDRPGRRKWKCRHCGGTIDLKIVQYIRGYEASGGDGRDVWSEWDV